ncbi:MAG: mitochondrial fission ELM1 family protein [Alphaproteobacteria bacterium]|jgi:mitochondrial fission protein ELM1|nr:mitochondrial fission ELM1 family protein [Alphaproteobacteria bacterium]MCV6599110.1 mitochondrial fission ELM1 family protein [Alphaproteobacteria bacterium]
MIKNKKCWVVTDGKIGTLNQCIGLADNLVDSYQIKTITLKKIWDKINPYIRIDSINPTTEKFSDKYPDILIVSGRKAVSVGLHIKKKNPKTILICIQDPRVSRKKFDYIVIPEHDSLRAKNVILTTGAMHKLTDKKIKSEGKRFAHLFKSFKNKKTIAVLIGGNSRNHTMDLELTKKICDDIKEASKKLRANIVLTASRRTPEVCFDLIKKEFKRKRNTYIYDNVSDNPYFAFMDIADYIFVSSDSMSMLSEATFTGKPVYLIELKGGSKKFDKFHCELKKKKIIRVLGKDKIEDYSYARVENAKDVAMQIEGEIKNDSKK